MPSSKPARILHPKLQEHAANVKAAHAHLAATRPGFKQLKPADQFRHVQAHIRKGGAGC